MVIRMLVIMDLGLMHCNLWKLTQGLLLKMY